MEDGFITGETADAIMAYMKAVEEAKTITTDINARYEAFANAEAMLINNALVIPMGMSVPPYLATRLNYWEGQYASTGFSNKRLFPYKPGAALYFVWRGPVSPHRKEVRNLWQAIWPGASGTRF